MTRVAIKAKINPKKLNVTGRGLRQLGMVVTKRDGEYRVNYRHGKEATAYYTNDLIDAVGTALAMSKRSAADKELADMLLLADKKNPRRRIRKSKTVRHAKRDEFGRRLVSTRPRPKTKKARARHDWVICANVKGSRRHFYWHKRGAFDTSLIGIQGYASLQTAREAAKEMLKRLPSKIESLEVKRMTDIVNR